jgi:acyl-CoA synthetase (NDP forming)
VTAVESARITEIIEHALAEGRATLHESDGLDVLDALGVRTPGRRLVRHGAELESVDFRMLGDPLVLKVVSSHLPHKTDFGGVAVVPGTTPAVSAAMADMARRLAGIPFDGFSLSQFVDHPADLGAELLVGLRRTEEFGPVVGIGAGGIHAESLARALRPEARLALFADPRAPLDRIVARLARHPITRIAGGLERGGRRFVALEVLAEFIVRLLRLAQSPAGRRISELEINPLALAPCGPVALDVLVRVRRPERPVSSRRPLEKLEHLLAPRTIALVGVSEAPTKPGRLILQNLLRGGFPPERLWVVKPGADQVEGVRCVPTLAALPECVDLLVVAVAAARAPALLAEVIATRKAESLIVIPGGLGEREGTETLERELRARLAAARQTPWRGPVLNGGNCLGVRSAPGGYDTTFIPEHKMPRPSGDAAPVAILAQSGAFAFARWSRMPSLNPRYLVSVGNQTDLTLGDYLTYLRGDPAVRLFACYVEGFRPLDGRQWLDAAAAIVAEGRSVLLFRNARTPAGVRVGTSHTAAVAGDYAVLRELARDAGVVVAETLEDFDDFLRLHAAFADRLPAGTRLGAVSNAGFECVAAGDAPAPLLLAPLGPGTRARLEGLLAAARLEDIVQVRHPMDVTPTMPDAGFAEAVRAVLEDKAVDIGVVGAVPLTAALQTLPPGPGHREDCGGVEALAALLGRIRRDVAKPWAAVVDAGTRYDPLVARLEDEGIPTFRTMDHALRALAVFAAEAARGATRAQPDLHTAGTDAW